jgi:hypothetical protein
MLTGVPSQLPAGRSLTLYFRVVDREGIPVLDINTLRFTPSVVTGGGSLSGLSPSDIYPNLVYTTLSMGSDPGPNIFRVSFASLPPHTFSVTGTKP